MILDCIVCRGRGLFSVGRRGHPDTNCRRRWRWVTAGRVRRSEWDIIWTSASCKDIVADAAAASAQDPGNVGSKYVCNQSVVLVRTCTCTIYAGTGREREGPEIWKNPVGGVGGASPRCYFLSNPGHASFAQLHRAARSAVSSKSFPAVGRAHTASSSRTPLTRQL